MSYGRQSYRQGPPPHPPQRSNTTKPNRKKSQKSGPERGMSRPRIDTHTTENSETRASIAV